MAEKLDLGDTFPDVTLNYLDGGSVTLPGDLESPYTFVLFYRGHW